MNKLSRAAATIGISAILTVSGAAIAQAAGSGYTYANPSLNMRTDASTSAAVILSIPYHTQLSVQCVKYGTTVSNSYGSSNIWDYVSYAGRSGFVSDQWVNTGTNGPSAPVCGTPAHTPRTYTAQISANTWLESGDQIVSANGHEKLVMQTDGNLVSYWDGAADWASNTAGRSGFHAILQGDANLVLYQASTPRWAANTVGTGATKLAVQDDGNVVLYTASGKAV